MKWPWVSRARLAEVEAALAHQRQAFLDTLSLAQAIKDGCVREAATATARADGAEKRCDALLEKYHALKLMGAEAPAPRVVLEKREPDPVVLAVNAAGRSPAVRSLMLQQAKRDRAAGMDDTEIIDRIERGTGVDGVPG